MYVSKAAKNRDRRPKRSLLNFPLSEEWVTRYLIPSKNLRLRHFLPLEHAARMDGRIIYRSPS